MFITEGLILLRSEERHMYTTTYPQGCKHAPYVVMHKTVKGM